MNVKIDHGYGVVDVDFFNNFSLELKYDSVASGFGFSFYFDPQNKQHAELACVSHYHGAIIEHNGKRLLTGTILNPSFSDGSQKELAQFGGYSKPGVLEDSKIPPSLYPLQNDGLTLAEIARKLIQPFGLKMIIDPAVADKMNTKIETTTAKESQTIKSYLTELTVQRRIVMSHDVAGNLLFTKAKTDLKPLFHVEKGLIGTNIQLSFGGQAIHSHITVMKQADSDSGNAGEYTIENPYCPVNHVYRPEVIIQTSGTDITTEEAARNALAAELKNITLKITTDRWEIDGDVVTPNNIITVTYPGVFLYKETEWFIESVTITGDEKKTTAVLTCVPPEAYNGKTPKNIFVNPHENLPRF
jgi:prophage tail gpP-like protein